jgi:hypothetical protein
MSASNDPNEGPSSRVGAIAARFRLRSIGPGLLLAAIAVLALIGARGLPVGTRSHIGPGAVPDVLAALLLVLGLVVAAERFSQRSIAGEE